MATHDRHLPMTNDGYLTGQLLVATPQIQFSCFHRSVIYLASHNAEGAMGFIINQPMQHLSFAGVMDHFKIPVDETVGNQPIYFGGPIDTARGYVLHSSDYSSYGTTPANYALSITSSLDILKDIAAGRGPSQKLLVLGYSGWSAGQLESELQSNSWITVPATEELLFGDMIADKWMLSNKSLGVDPYRISDVAGHA